MKARPEKMASVGPNSHPYPHPFHTIALELEAQQLNVSSVPATPLVPAFTPITFDEWIAGGCVTPDTSVWFEVERIFNPVSLMVEEKSIQRTPDVVFNEVSSNGDLIKQLYAQSN